jgi:hypothetical protein
VFYRSVTAIIVVNVILFYDVKSKVVPVTGLGGL